MGFNFLDYRPSKNVFNFFFINLLLLLIKILKIFPFSSSTKKMTTIYKDNTDEMILFTKGAPENLLPKCDYYIDDKGITQVMNEEFRERITNIVIKNFSRQSLRTVLLAYSRNIGF